MSRYDADRPHLTGITTPILVEYGNQDMTIPSDRMACVVDRLGDQRVLLQAGLERLLDQQLAVDDLLEHLRAGAGARGLHLVHADLGAIHLGGDLRSASGGLRALATGGQCHDKRDSD